MMYSSEISSILAYSLKNMGHGPSDAEWSGDSKKSGLVNLGLSG
jgi:hypothetical protein